MGRQTPADLAASCRQAITTRFLGMTATLGPRVVASCEAGRITHQWDDSLDVAGNHAAAALRLFAKLGWDRRNELRMGGRIGGGGYVFVQVDPTTEQPRPRRETMEFRATDLVPYAIHKSVGCCDLRINWDDLRVWTCREHGGVMAEAVMGDGCWHRVAGSCKSPVVRVFLSYVEE